MKKKKLLMSLIFLSVLLIMLLPEAAAVCIVSGSAVNCCPDASAGSLDGSSWKREYTSSYSYVAVEANDYCTLFSILRNGTCYNREDNGRYTYDACINASRVTECFIQGRHAFLNDQLDISMSTAYFGMGYPSGIPCPTNYICLRGGKSCTPKKTCTTNSNCDPCMSCTGGYCNYNDSMSCTGCGSSECTCNWGLCINASCTDERVNTFDCSSCSDTSSGNCRACCDQNVAFACRRDAFNCVLAPDSNCNGGLGCNVNDDPRRGVNLECCVVPTSRILPKLCSEVTANSCGVCCPHVTGPCEGRTQTQCTAETAQCGWCGGSCVNTTLSDSFCGSCTNACASNERCENSICILLPPSCDLRNETICESFGDDCRWCPVPAGANADDFSTYPYMISEPSPNSYGCVGTLSDPFNCGGCGFDSSGMASYSSSGGGFCDSSTPFCINRNCVDRNSASCSSTAQLDTPYYYNISHTLVIDNWNLGRNHYTYSSAWCDNQNTSSVYSISDYDLNELVCSQLTGGSYDFSSSLGCCGNNKCRAEEGALCNITALCDGTRWRTGADSDGTVFDATCSPYPIANINGEFIKCIDSDRYVNYSLMMNTLSSAGNEACILGSADTSINFNLTGVLDYSCGPNRYSSGTIALVEGDTDVCKLQNINTSYVAAGGELVCVGWGNSTNVHSMYGFVSLLNRTVNVWGSSNNEYAQCPAPVDEWVLDTSPDFISSKPPFVMPCPGKLTLTPNQVPNIIQIALYGGDSSRAALLCRATQPTGTEGLGSLRYVSGDGSRMGRVNNHDYMCYTGTSGTPGYRARIAVCCGSQACNVPGTVAELLTQGQTVTVNGNLWTCQHDGTWSSDLDFDYTQSTCTQSGFFATGTYCCSEPDDNTSSIWIKESYNQTGGPGGCFKGTGQTNNRVLSYNGISYPDVYVANGSFYGCGFDSAFTSEFDQDNQNLCQPAADGSLSMACLQSIENWPDPGSDFSNTSARRTRAPLINRAGYCSGFSTPGSLTAGVYCAYNNTWSQTSLLGVTRESTIPNELGRDLLSYFRTHHNVPGLTQSGCCNTTTCWGPNGCHAEQLAPNERYNLSSNLFYKCMQGNWTALNHLQTTPNSCESGVCPDQSQCVYSFVNPSYLGCIDNGQYINDSLCANGSWISRTKMLALKLADLTSGVNNFVLMCGPPADVLVNVNTSQSTGNSNNFCVLNLNGQRIIGTTLNQQFYNASNLNTFVNSLMWSFNNIYQYMAGDVNYPASFDFTCNEASTDFVQCMGSGANNYLRLYYDKTYQIVIFSNRNIDGLTPSFGDTICGVLPSWLKWLCPSPSSLARDLAGVKLFNKIYAAKNGTKQVFGVTERICTIDIYSFNYTGYLKEELMPLILYPDEGVFKNFTSDNTIHNTIFISKSSNDPWDPWASLTILRNLEQP